jgi:hypothetical protein
MDAQLTTLRRGFALSPDPHPRGGPDSYYQQVLGAVLVHPDHREVIPLAPEMIISQDGTTKNDCERNATKRFLARFRDDYPRLPVIVIADGLSSNGPHSR